MRLQHILHVERERLMGAGGVASAVGYALPLLGGMASGHRHAGVMASTGALIVGFADLGGVRRVRVCALLATALAVGLAALLGGLVGADAVVVVGVWGFVAGLSTALGTRAAFVGVLSTWALLIASDLHLHGTQVDHAAVLFTAGGLLQALVSLPLVRGRELTGPAVRSGVLAHAVRLGLALTVAVALYQALDLRFGYWLPVTVLFVLRPDRDGTVTRALERALGTIAGVALASLLLSSCHPPDGVIILLLSALALPGYVLYFANYTLSTLFLTVSVALLVELGGGSPIGALGDRLLDTTTGAAIALAAIALTPTRNARSAKSSAWLSQIAGRS
jgi:uncharacterized membrane protein YccC